MGDKEPVGIDLPPLAFYALRLGEASQALLRSNGSLWQQLCALLFCQAGRFFNAAVAALAFFQEAEGAEEEEEPKELEEEDPNKREKPISRNVAWQIQNDSG